MKIDPSSTLFFIVLFTFFSFMFFLPFYQQDKTALSKEKCVKR